MKPVEIQLAKKNFNSSSTTNYEDWIFIFDEMA